MPTPFARSTPLPPIAVLTAALLGLACGPATPAPAPVTADLSPITPAPAAGPLTLRALWTRKVEAADPVNVEYLARSASGDLLLLASMPDAYHAFAFDAEGKPRWDVALHEAGDGYLHAGGLGFLGDQAVIAGEFAARLEVNGKLVLETEKHAGFLLSLDRGGKLLWSRRFTTDASTIPRMAVDSAGTIWFASMFKSNASLGSAALKGSGAGDSSFADLFVARLDRTGEVQWAIGLPGRAYPAEMVDDGAGHMLLAGDFIGGQEFGETRLEGDNASWKPRRGAYLVQLDGKGHVRWARAMPVQSPAGALDGSGDTFFCSDEKAAAGHYPTTLVGVGPDGRKKLDQKLDKLSCFSVAGGPGDRLLVTAVPSSDDPGARLIEMDTKGATVRTVELPPTAVLMGGGIAHLPIVPDGKGGAYLAEVFNDADKARKVILYRAAR